MDKLEPARVVLSRQEWLEWRRSGIGGSDAPIIMGLSKHRGRLGLFVDKMGRGEDPDEPTEAAMWGTRIEALVAERFSEVTGFVTRHPQYLVRHPVHAFMIGTPDRYVYTHDGATNLGILEVKTCSLRREWEWDPEPPAAAVCQLRHYLAVTDSQVGWLAVLIGGQRYLHYRVERDPDYEARLILEEKQFWRHVEFDVPPEPDGRDSTSRIIDERYPEARPLSTVEFTGEARDVLIRLIAEHSAVRRSREEYTRLQNLVKLALGDAEMGLIDGRPAVSWRGSRRKSVDVAALRLEAPELVERYTREVGLRTFRVHPLGGRVDTEYDSEEDDDAAPERGGAD